MFIIESRPPPIIESRPPTLWDYTRELNFGLGCASEVSAGGAGITRNLHNMGKTAGNVDIDYDMFFLADEMNVYYRGQQVATTGGPVSGIGTLSFFYDPQPYEATFIVVEVIGPSGTLWEYAVYCPEPI